MEAQIPVAPPERLPRIREHCDRPICLHAPEPFWAVGRFYDDFTPVEDEQAVERLRGACATFPAVH